MRLSISFAVGGLPRFRHGVGFDARGPPVVRESAVSKETGDVGLLLLVPLSFDNASSQPTDNPHRPDRPQHPLRVLGLPFTAAESSPTTITQ